MASPQAQTAQARQAAALKQVSGWIKTSSYVPPKTPWGDPDIQGGYSNVNENGIPFEKPGNLANRQVEEIDDSELAELQRERNERALASAAGIGGRETGAGPVRTGMSTTTRRTAAPGWWSIRRMDAFRNRRPRRSSVPAGAGGRGAAPALPCQRQGRRGRAGAAGAAAGGRGGFGEGGARTHGSIAACTIRCITRGFPDR